MKKTIIAAAVAAAASSVVVAPAAFADVSISGMVNAEIMDRDTATTTTNGYASSAVNTDLVLKGSEDLGNGMKASFTYHMYHDSGSDSVADTKVALSGDFGTVVAGRMESLHEGVAQAFTNIDASHDLDVENTMYGSDAGNRVNSAVAYVSPTVNGVHVAAAAIQGEDFAGGNDIIVMYSANGLTAFANRLNLDVDAGTGIATNDLTATAYGVGYKMGDLEVRAMTRNIEKGTLDNDSTFIGAKYTMGANTFAVGQVDDDTNGDMTIWSVSHALSKNTSVYIANLSGDENAATTNGASTAAGSAQTEGTVIGVVQKF
jgi:predicted porin